MNNYYRMLIALISVAFFSACSPSLKTVRANFNKATVCCESLSQIEYQAMSKSSISIALGESHQNIRLFDGSESFFSAYQLPNDNRSTLVVRSFIVGTWLPSAHILMPRLWFLDENFQKLYEPNLKTRWESDFWKGDFLSYQIPLKGNEKYVIVFSENRNADQTIPYTQVTSGLMPVMTGSSTIYIPTGNSSIDYELPVSPGGELQIKVVSK